MKRWRCQNVIEDFFYWIVHFSQKERLEIDDDRPYSIIINTLSFLIYFNASICCLVNQLKQKRNPVYKRKKKNKLLNNPLKQRRVPKDYAKYQELFDENGECKKCSKKVRRKCYAHHFLLWMMTCCAIFACKINGTCFIILISDPCKIHWKIMAYFSVNSAYLYVIQYSSIWRPKWFITGKWQNSMNMQIR